MNILGFVFSILLILSYAVFACWEKQSSSQKLSQMYIGHQKANRKFLSQYEIELYRSLREKKETQTTPSTPPSLLVSSKEKKEEELELPALNAECARINLWPLMTQGKEAHPFLYEICSALLLRFYGPSLFENQKQAVHSFLDHLLESGKKSLLQPTPFSLEKIELSSSKDRAFYYAMLKGKKAKQENPSEGYPPFLDYFKADPHDEKLCLLHAHLQLLTALFNEKVAMKLYAEMHQEKAPPLTREFLDELLKECHFFTPSEELYDLLVLNKQRHEKGPKRTLVAEDETSQISLRKNVYLQSS